MRKPSRAVSEGSDELRPEYRFDYSKARPNPDLPGGRKTWRRAADGEWIEAMAYGRRGPRS